MRDEGDLNFQTILKTVLVFKSVVPREVLKSMDGSDEDTLICIRSSRQ